MGYRRHLAFSQAHSFPSVLSQQTVSLDGPFRTLNSLDTVPVEVTGTKLGQHLIPRPYNEGIGLREGWCLNDLLEDDGEPIGVTDGMHPGNPLCPASKASRVWTPRTAC